MESIINASNFYPILFLIVFFVVMYAVSLFSICRYNKVAYGKSGRWEGSSVKLFESDLYSKYTPVINTLIAMILWCFFNPHKKIN